MKESSRTVLDVAGAGVARVALLPNGVAFVDTSNGKQRIRTEDLATKKQRTIASTPAAGIVNGLATTGPWIVWVQQSRQQNDPVDPVSWTMIAYNTQTGAQRTVARSTTSTPLPPIPVAADGRVAWASYLGLKSGKSDLWVADLASGKATRIVPDARSGQVALNNDALIYTVTESLDEAKHIDVENLFSVPLAGGKPQRLSGSGTAGLPTASGDLLVWQDHINGEGLLVSLRLATGGAPAGNPAVVADDALAWGRPGTDFVAYLGPVTDGTVDVSPASPGPARKLRLPNQADVCIPCNVATDGQRLAWGYTIGDNDDRTMLVVSTIVPS